MSVRVSVQRFVDVELGERQGRWGLDGRRSTWGWIVGSSSRNRGVESIEIGRVEGGDARPRARGRRGARGRGRGP